MKGIYEAIIVSHALAKSRENETPSVKLKLAVMKDIKTSIAVSNKVLYYDAWLTDKCFKRTMDLLSDVLGWSGSNLNELHNTEILVDKEVWILVAD